MKIIFFVILLDLIGFGIMVPLLPYFALNLGGGPEIATLCVALYAVGMIISTPILGRISDFYGRRPILMFSMAGSVLGYLFLSFADTILMVAAARLISGFMAGNIATAQAYITDITSEENRAKGMGIIGAAFGLGFIIGPFLGSVLAGNDFQTANLWLAAMTSAGLSGLGFLAVVFMLPESLSPKHRAELKAKKRVNQFEAFRRISVRPVIMALLIAILMYNVAAGMAESILPIWSEAIGIAKGPSDLMPLLLAAGITLSVVQGGLVGPLSKKLGEKKLVLVGLSIFCSGLMFMGIGGINASFWGVLAALSWQSAGAGLVIPSLQSLVSKRAGPTERGMVMGLYSTSGMLGRVLGTVATGIVFANIHIQSPYFGASLIVFALILITISLQKKLDQKPHIEA